jgi:hypothetical protein
LKKEAETTVVRKGYEDILKEAQEAAQIKLNDVMETEFGVGALYLGKDRAEWVQPGATPALGHRLLAMI